MHGIWGLRIRLRVVLVVACLRSARAEKISKLPLLRKVTPQLELPVSLEGGGLLTVGGTNQSQRHKRGPQPSYLLFQLDFFAFKALQEVESPSCKHFSLQEPIQSSKSPHYACFYSPCFPTTLIKCHQNFELGNSELRRMHIGRGGTAIVVKLQQSLEDIGRTHWHKQWSPQLIQRNKISTQYVHSQPP
jgi:hypothetical protein